jgi:hypothetical protein
LNRTFSSAYRSSCSIQTFHQFLCYLWKMKENFD